MVDPSDSFAWIAQRIGSLISNLEFLQGFIVVERVLVIIINRKAFFI